MPLRQKNKYSPTGTAIREVPLSQVGARVNPLLLRRPLNKEEPWEAGLFLLSCPMRVLDSHFKLGLMPRSIRVDVPFGLNVEINQIPVPGAEVEVFQPAPCPLNYSF